ncbi:hypothetical protein PFLG_01390, partial [Plasmodium falciparum RAJ116]
ITNFMNKCKELQNICNDKDIILFKYKQEEKNLLQLIDSYKKEKEELQNEIEILEK